MNARRLISAWLPLALVASALAATFYVAVQQSYRMGANDVPRQIAEDAAAAMGRGDSPADVVGTATVDIGASLAPFVAVFDADGVLVASSARLDGATPQPPKGVMAAARANGSSSVTWQPKAGVRMATVTVVAPGDGGNTVMAGRSLREVEAHIDQLGQLTLLGWAASLVAAAVGVLAAGRLAKDRAA